MMKKDAAIDTGISLKNAFAFINLAVSLCIFMLGAWDDARLLIGIMLVVSSGYLLAHVRRNTILFVICFVMLFSNYSAVIANVSPPYTGFDTMYAASPYSAEALLVCLLFTSILLLLVPKRVATNTPFNFSLYVPHFRYRALATLMLSLVLALIFLGGVSEPSKGGRASLTSLFEYAYILLLAGFLLAGDNRGCRRVFVFFSILFIIQPLLGGNRANMLNVALLVFVIFFSQKITWRSLLPGLLLGTLFLIAFGYYRASDEFNILYVVSQMGNALETTIKNSFVWDTASYAFQQCIAFLDLKDEINSDTLFYLIGQWIQSWFLGSSAVPDSALAVYTQERISGLGGGFLPVYYYFYFGVPGILLSAVIVGFWLKKIAQLNQDTPPAIAFLTVGIAVTVCRWYLYSPAAFTSSMIFSVIICIFISFFIKGFFTGQKVICQDDVQTTGSKATEQFGALEKYRQGKTIDSVLVRGKKKLSQTTYLRHS